MIMKIGLVSLGCAKNLVDSEMLLGMLKSSGFELVDDPNVSDVIIINTCGFIEDAKKESIDVIFKMLEYKKRTVVTGCLVERYKEELKKLIPEVDLFIAIKDYPHLKELLNSLFDTSKISCDFDPLNRVLSTPPYTAYLRIGDGCNNHCSYCAIPLIRHEYRSRPLEEILLEAHILAKKGIKELVIIAQDTTKYGSDFSPKIGIHNLLQELLKIKQFVYIRLLYLYPDEVSDELINLIKKEKRLTPYFDLPIQHASNKILKAMNRRGDKDLILELIKKIRTKIPRAILRTTMIVGFPGESEEDFNELLDFVKEVEFDHLGAFTYSKEEDTVAFLMDNQVPNEIKLKRLDTLMKIQQSISYNKNKTHINEIMEGIVMEYDSLHQEYRIRTYWNAPDGVDGNIILKTNKKLNIGQLIKIKIINAFVYDLAGTLIS